jgi:hypothetical protein
MPKTQTDYTNTIIYKLCCKNPTVTDIFIGHTTNFTQRKNSHKTSCCNENSKNYNQNVYQFIRQNGGWDNWSMVQIELKNCKDKREAELIEHTFIQELKATLNVNNPYGMYKENPQQYKEDWYEENKEEILEKAKEYYEENKEQKLEYQKQYAEEHKEEIAEKQKEYREKNKDKLSEQKKEYRAAHKEEAAKAQKEWRESNKAKLKTQKAEIINCECGNQYTFGNKHRHLQSKVHINYQNQLCGIIEPDPEPKMSEEEKKEISRQKQKEYREKNSKKIKEFKKKYNEENKEHIKEQTHNYYQEHKDEIKLKAKQYVEENKDKVKEYKDSWYQKNKEKILEKQKQTFVCECGAEVRCSGKAEHLRSTKHKHYVESLQSLNL